MSVIESLQRLGGVATRADLIAATSRAEVDQALANDLLTVVARGRYASAECERARLDAHRLSGAVSWRSAAQAWGWEVKSTPERPDVTVPHNRKVSESQRAGVLLHRGSLHSSEVDEGCTTKARTLTDCMRGLPFDEALAIADSALRSGFSQRLLQGLALGARGPGAVQMRRVAALATPEAANAFESVLRAIALDVPGLHVRPQVSIYEPTFLGRPDLVDERLRILLEADSFEWHGNRAALKRDAQRYDVFTVKGWLVLRFAWEHVMFEPDWVKEMLVAAVAERSDRACHSCRAA